MDKTNILLVGTTHLNMPSNGDALMPNMPDILSEHRQLEIADFVEELSLFRPTKVCLEVNTLNQKDLDERYQTLAKSLHSATSDEREQIGFRLARRCNLKQVHAIDWNENEGYSLDSTIKKYPSEMGKILDSQQVIMNQIEILFRENSITDFYKAINHPTYSRMMHQAYLDIASLDDAATRWVTNYWYYRNLTIFKQVVRLREHQDRILVLYGLAHVHLLRQFLEESGAFHVHELTTIFWD